MTKVTVHSDALRVVGALYTMKIFATVCCSIVLGLIAWNVKTCNDPYLIVKADEGVFLVPPDATPFGGMHIMKEDAGWMLWLDETDKVTVVHHAQLVGYQRGNR